MVEALIDLTTAQIEAVHARAANLDAQALGLVGFDAALVTADLATQQLFGHWWWIPIPGLAISIALGASVMVVTRFDLGPSPSYFYARNVAVPRDDALTHLLSDLIVSQQFNAQPLHLKRDRLVLALATLLLTVVYSAIALAS